MHHLNLNVSLWMQRAADETECPSIDSEKLKLVNRIKEVALFVARSGEKQADTTYVATHSFTCASIHGSYVLMPESRALPSRQLNSIVPDDCTECAEFLFKPAALPGFVLDRPLAGS